MHIERAPREADENDETSKVLAQHRVVAARFREIDSSR